MSTNEKEIVLSIEETNALRLKLGLKPLNITNNGDSTTNNAPLSQKVTSEPSSNNEVLELSIQETNTLRSKLGLKPLNNTTNTKVIHAPARNIAKEKEIQERILEAKMKREVDLGIQKIEKSLEKEGGNGNGEDLDSWIDRMRKKADTNEEKNSDKTKKVKKKRKKEPTEEESPLAVPEKAKEGMVLTLKDEEILEQENESSTKLRITQKKDSLEHASWHDIKKAQEYKKGKLEANGGVSGGFVDVDIEEEQQQESKDVKLQIASDYMTLEEEEMNDTTSFKKSQIKAQKKLLKQFKRREKKSKKNLKRFREEEKETNDEQEIEVQKVDEDNEDEMKRRKEKYAQAMKAATLRSQNAFLNENSDTTVQAVTQQPVILQEKENEDDAKKMAEMLKAKRLAKLKKLNKKSTADAVVDAIKSKQVEEEKNDGDALTFELDDTQEFTRTMRAAIDTNNDTIEKEKDSQQKEEIQTNGEEEVDIHELAAQMQVENDTIENDDNEEEPVFGTNKSVGRGLSSVLTLLQSTGDISTTKNPHASKEKLRGRAKDERHYDDYSNLDLSKTVKINAATEKDKEFASRQIKLDYRDEHGRLLTRKEAFRQMCYQFHGYGSHNKTKEKRLKAMQREQALGAGDGNGDTLGVLKKMQEVTGKAFVVHKT